MDIAAGDLIIGLMMGAFGLIGLFLASGAHDVEMYVFGLTLAVWAVLFEFGLLRRHFDRLDAARVAAIAEGHRQAGRHE